MAGRRALNGVTDAREAGAAGRMFRATLLGLSLAILSIGFIQLVSVYDLALRDPRFLDGWVLAAGMAVQLYFHVATARSSLSPKAAVRWRKFHVLTGCLLIPVFALHTNFGLPDTIMEWALWICFALISSSGVLGICLSWRIRSQFLMEGPAFERIPSRRKEIARAVQSLATASDTGTSSGALPPPPCEAWLNDLYIHHLEGFLERPSSTLAHLIGSHHQRKRLTDEIDQLTQFVDRDGLDRLAAIKSLLIEKDRLDAAHVAHALSRIWLLVHVPATYALALLTVAHILIAYAFSSGAW